MRSKDNYVNIKIGTDKEWDGEGLSEREIYEST